MTTVFKALQDALRDLSVTRGELRKERELNRVLVCQRDELIRRLLERGDAKTADEIRTIAARHAPYES
jgi:hypothetical protein